MTAEHWEKIKDLLDEVLKIEPARRTRFLEKVGINGEIRAEVESLLAFEGQSRKFMSLTLGEFSKDFVAEELPEISLIGQKIGIYEITGELGFGGMGAVYLAERTDGKFAQRVALKMIKRELNIGEIRKNFKREREILSKLNHPFIARLLDAGTTADGVPYLVMEYVEGVPIDDFCASGNLNLTARLKLFNKICDAVFFAHQNLIIHRDLKPSNILVTEKGEPKLLDFGISKLLDAEENTVMTAFGAMTPEYASPEQIRGETVSTTTDIYSLGVVLYKMLTGALPYNLNGKKTNSDVLKVITEDEPTAPSAIQDSRFKIQDWDSQNPKSKIQNLKLKGDLDNIILKSLRKEPVRRYQTVEQFSADIWRHIDGLPVTARRATFAYRLNKFIRRNKIAVIAAVLIFVSLISGIAVAFRQAQIANEQARVASESRRFAEIETEKAKAEQLKSEKVTRFMSKIIGYANPNWYAEGAKFGKDARVIDAILDLCEKIDAEFAGEPDVAAELHHKFTEVIGGNAGSLPPEKQKELVIFHSGRALELRRQFYGERHELVAKDLYYFSLFKSGEERAETLMHAILMMRETNPNNLNYPYMLEDYTAHIMLPEFEKSHQIYRNAVQPPTDENNYQIAERMLRESLPIFRLHYEKDNEAVISAECKLSYVLAMQEKWTDFDEHFQICRQTNTNSSEKILFSTYSDFVELVEKVLEEKNIKN